MTVLDEGKHPLLARSVIEAGGQRAEDRSDQVFATGLDRILDGLIPERRQPDGS